jgi:hypothetical protein
MRRAAPLLVVLVFPLVACGAESPELPDVAAAAPQNAVLHWQESYGKPGTRLVFRVSAFRVTPTGWSADVEVQNDSRTSYSLGGKRASLDRTFGVMLFRTGDMRELRQRNAAQELPDVRGAETFSPALPALLAAGATWRGTMSAAGALVSKLWVRIVFGPFVAVGDPPQGLQDPVVWITDHTHQLV